jgi:deazaflavin-dependent oxidoreductase (nitroreductase family)
MTEGRGRNRIRSIANFFFGTVSGRGLRAYSLVGHVGRISGREYWNPVSAYPFGDGYVIPILYGRQSQWVQNSLAAGSLRLRTKGREHLLVDPEIIPAERALSAFPHWQRMVMRTERTVEVVWGHLQRRAAADGPPIEAYRRPSRFRSLFIDPTIGTLVIRCGLGRGNRGDDPLRVLRVRGRISGRLLDVPIRVAVIDGERYLVSMAGEAHWVRNLRASPTAQLVVGKDTETIKADEIHGDEKSAFLASYLVHPAFRTAARFGFGVDTRRLTDADIAFVAERHPVFRLEPTRDAEERAASEWPNGKAPDS